MRLSLSRISDLTADTTYVQTFVSVVELVASSRKFMSVENTLEDERYEPLIFGYSRYNSHTQQSCLISIHYTRGATSNKYSCQRQPLAEKELIGAHDKNHSHRKPDAILTICLLSTDYFVTFSPEHLF